MIFYKGCYLFKGCGRMIFARMTMLFALSLCGIGATAQAQTAQQTFDQNKRNADEVSARLAREREKERLRDKSHDNRLKVGKDTSVGAGKDGVNIRHTTK
jgi:hypothetical protein